MIVVSVILLSAQDGRSEELARMEICNMGTGSATMGNYSAETLRGRSTQDFARRTRQRIAYVSNHPRKREHVWNLVAKALRNLRYGGDWKEADQIEISGVQELTIVSSPSRPDQEALIEALRPLLADIAHPTAGLEWTLPWRVQPCDGKPTIVSNRGGNLFRGFIGTWKEADLIVAAVNALPTLFGVSIAGGDAA